MCRRAACELAFAALGRRVHAQQRKEVGGVIVHRQLGARLGAACGLHAAWQDLFLHAHHAMPKRVVRHQITEVGTEGPIDALEVVDRVLLDGKATHARQAFSEQEILVQPAQVIIQIGVTCVGGCDLVAVFLRGRQ